MSTFFHEQGYDVFILSMPLKGINLGPGSTDTKVNSDHWWFLQWEEKVREKKPNRFTVEFFFLECASRTLLRSTVLGALTRAR